MLSRRKRIHDSLVELQLQEPKHSPFSEDIAMKRAIKLSNRNHRKIHSPFSFIITNHNKEENFLRLMRPNSLIM